MLVELLTKRGKRDLLVPYFTFRQLPSKQQEMAMFKEIAQLRYEVYCAECKFLEAANYESGLETDDFDDRSLHVAAQNHEGYLVGTARLVLGSPRDVFPFEEHCSVFPDFIFPPKEQSAEVSRLIVKKNFRRRPGDTLQGISREFQETGTVDDIAPQQQAMIKHKDRRSTSPQIMLGMYREMYRYSRMNGIRYWYAAMEKGLARMLARMGFHFDPVGPVTDYYGPVTTYIADLHQMEVAMSKSNRFLLAWFQDEHISDWLLIKTLVKYKLGHLGKL
jgi:N-acyl amino acid synthase of PEP-CTERM/exosortase system